MTVINRAPWNALIDDPGNNLEGSEWNKAAIAGTLLDPIDAALAQVDAATVAGDSPDYIVVGAGGTVNNLALNQNKYVHVVVYTGGSLLTITGTTGARKDGERLTIITTGFQVAIPHRGASANQFFNRVYSAPTLLAAWEPGGQNGSAGGSASYVYVSAIVGWKLVAHDQGGWITPAYSAANFTGTQGGWTVAAGGMSTCAFYLRGRTVAFDFMLSGNFGAPPPGYLVIYPPAWGGYNPALASSVPIVTVDGAYNAGVMFVDAGSATRLYKNGLAVFTSTSGGAQGQVNLTVY